MGKNYLIITLRNLRKHKGYTIINVVGLAIGLAGFVLIARYIQHETSYDRFHENGDRIYRITSEYADERGYADHRATTDHRLAPLITDAFPEVEHIVRVERSPKRVQHDGASFIERNLVFVDPAFFEVFSFELLHGDPAEVLAAPNTAVLSTDLAQKYFGNANPIGQSLTIDQGTESFEVYITGLMAPMPETSHFESGFLISQETTQRSGYATLSSRWIWRLQYTYLLLEDEAEVTALEQDLEVFPYQYLPDSLQNRLRFEVQALNDIHLYSQLNGEYKVNGDIRKIWIFSAIAFILLLIACINYINLATARAEKRAKEVGVRKAVGALKQQIIYQFLIESVVLTTLALVLGIVLAEAALPFFNEVVSREIAFAYGANLGFFALMGAATLVIALLAGSYPAFFLSRIQPATILKGHARKGAYRGITLRKGLVLVQYALSIALIVCTLVVRDQVDLLRTKQVGINTEQVVAIPLSSMALVRGQQALRANWLDQPGVLSIGATDAGLATELHTEHTYKVDETDETSILQTVRVDETFLDVMEADFVDGRGFSEERPTDLSDAFVLNEMAAARLGARVGQRLESPVASGAVIGIVEDYHYGSFHTPVQPVVFRFAPNQLWRMHVRLSPDNLSATLASMEAAWRDLAGDLPMNYAFVQDSVAKLYRAEEQFMQAISLFALLALFISCAGVLGLTSFTVQQRQREIGIRKVLGATAFQVNVLLMRMNLGLVLLASLIAWPTAFLVMQAWTASFVYPAPVQTGLFLIATAVAFVVTLGTVSVHTIRAVRVSPAHTLRSE